MSYIKKKKKKNWPVSEMQSLVQPCDRLPFLLHAAR